MGLDAAEPGEAATAVENVEACPHYMFENDAGAFGCDVCLQLSGRMQYHTTVTAEREKSGSVSFWQGSALLCEKTIISVKLRQTIHSMIGL